MIATRELGAREASSVLGRASPLATLAIATGWLVGLACTTRPLPPVILALVALAAGLLLGRIRAGSLLRGLAPLWLAALTVTFFNAVLAPENADPVARVVVGLGPLHLTEPALAAGLAIGLRVVAIAAVGVVFAGTTDATRLVDALVQQARVPERFAFGALAAFQAIPRLAEDLVALRQARRIRGLRASWHPRLLVGLLVLAIRHADRLAVAMDARGFGSGPRSRFREVRWTRGDTALVAAGTAVLAAVLLLAG